MRDKNTNDTADVLDRLLAAVKAGTPIQWVLVVNAAAEIERLRSVIHRIADAGRHADKARTSGAISKLGSALEVKTVSKSGAVLEVKAVPIPSKIQSMMAEAIRGERR